MNSRTPVDVGSMRKKAMPRLRFPNDHGFAFTVFDDTDNSTITNTRPVYDFLSQLGFRTTKSVWAEPPRGPSSGSCLRDEEYRAWVQALQADGFEIGFHGVGDGDFTREEILSGIEFFRETLGQYPRIHANHQSNAHNVYWWGHRFPSPFNHLYTLANRIRRRQRHPGGGHVEDTAIFWGDALKEHIQYIRNFTFNGVNTLSRDPKMPYRRQDTPLANQWFSSSDGHTVEEFNALVSPRNIDRLQREGGVCIVYTHFASGFVDGDGNLDPVFRARMERLAERNGWFVPCSTILDHLSTTQSSTRTTSTVGYQRLLALRWGLDRLVKRLRFGR